MKYLAYLCYIALTPLGLCLIALMILLTPQNDGSETLSFRTSSVDKTVEPQRLEVAHILMKNRARLIEPSDFASEQDELNWLYSRYKLYAVPSENYRSY